MSVSKGENSIGTRTLKTNDLPKLLKLSYQSQLPVDNNYPFCPLPGESKLHEDGSYSMKIYLPNHIFMLTLKFDCLLKGGSTDVLPKITEYVTKQLEIISNTAQRETYQYSLTIGDMPLIDYLHDYGGEVDNVKEFSEIYAGASKTIQRELSLSTSDEQKRPNNPSEYTTPSARAEDPRFFQGAEPNNQPNQRSKVNTCSLL